MKEMDHYIEAIVSGMPIKKEEKEELKEEISSHIQEHIKELMVKGYSEEQATCTAIQVFGSERKLNRKLKTAVFPFYKVVRFLWNLIAMTVLFTAASYFTEKFYHPASIAAVPVRQILLLMILLVLLTGIIELFYETAKREYKANWIINPWVFYLLPALLVGGIMSLNLIENPSHYQDGSWVELFAVPIGAFAYLLSRQLFTLLFVRNRRSRLSDAGYSHDNP